VYPSLHGAEEQVTQLQAESSFHQAQWAQDKAELVALRQQAEEAAQAWRQERQELVDKTEQLSREGAAAQLRDARILEMEGEKRELAARLVKREAEISRLAGRVGPAFTPVPTPPKAEMTPHSLPLAGSHATNHPPPHDTEESEQLTTTLSSTRQELWKANESLSTLHATTIAAESGHEALLARIDQLTKAKDWLAQELEEKAKAFTTYRQEKGAQFVAFQSDLQAMTLAKHALESARTALEVQVRVLEKRVQELQDKVQEGEHAGLLAQQQFKNEMLSQKKLSALYQGQAEQLGTVNAELEALLHEMERNAHKMAADHASLQQEREEDQLAHQERMEAKDAEIARLAGQLDLINAQVEQSGAEMALGILSPSAAAASKLMRSGKSYTEMYSEYTHLQASLMQEKRETAHLSASLNELYAELHERGPAVQQLQAERDSSMQQMDQLTHKVERLREQEFTYQRSLKEATLRIGQLEMENRLSVQEAKDLGQQVQHLACALEYAQSHPDATDFGEGQAGTAGTSDGTADSIISGRLVLFRTVEDLQKQNATLRRSLRSLSLKMEERVEEAEAEAQHTSAKELEGASAMIEALQEQLRIVNLKMDTFIRERDQWKSIAETRGGPRALAAAPISRAASPVPAEAAAAAAAAGQEYERLYRELTRDFDAFKRETATDVRLLKESLSTTQEEKSGFALQVAKLEAQLTLQVERYERYVEHASVYQRERDDLRQQLSAMSAASSYQDAKAQEQAANLLESRREAERIREAMHATRLELTVLRSSETRVAKEAADLLKERNAANERLAKVQFSLSERELLATAAEAKFTAKLQEAERDAQVAQLRVTELTTQLQALGSRKETEVKEYQAKVERYLVQVEKVKGELELTHTKEEHALARVADLTAQLTAAQERLAVYQQPSATSGVGAAPATPEQAMREVQVALAAAR
jgi:nucleoprotein TPR